MSPQSCSSEVHRLFSLRLLIGCVSVSSSGLGWDSKLLRCLSDLKTNFVPRSRHSASIIKTSQLMLYREIIAVCSQIHTKHIT